MALYCLGSINADHFYRVPHFVAPGETLAAETVTTGLGGKGANQSVAAARLGAQVFHVGCVGSDGLWARDKLEAYGVGVDHIGVHRTEPTGHAVIFVNPEGENAIVIYSGSNLRIDIENAAQVLKFANSKDTLLLQNETNGVAELAEIAKGQGVFVTYSAAPFDVEATQEVLPHVDLLVVNEVEADQLSGALGIGPTELPVPELLVTYGAKGARWHDLRAGDSHFAPAFEVEPVDTTGAGDTFIGAFSAARDQGKDPAEALRFASAASALQVTKEGTAEAMPSLTDVVAFLEERG